jgi:hypothetical protein
MAKRHKPDMDGEDMASPMFGGKGKRGGKRKKGRKGKRKGGRY